LPKPVLNLLFFRRLFALACLRSCRRSSVTALFTAA
jgi:hypothetical protein